MTLRIRARKIKNKIQFWVFKFSNLNKQSFECPICTYKGPFMDFSPLTGTRKHAKCPSCGALERHRIQFLVIKDILKNLDKPNTKMLHFAPEHFFRSFFSKQFIQYECADLNMKEVDHQNVDLQDLPFENATYDFVFVSHVLEHVPDDRKAISEIRRILKPNGIAILPVPIFATETIEYFKPIPTEFDHVRAPGLDYFERYKNDFSKVEVFTSEIMPEKYQLYLCEDRSIWPSENCPLRQPMEGEKHSDIVPVCYV